MRIELIKKATINGKKRDKGFSFCVVNEYGQELIDSGKAVKVGEVIEPAPEVIEEQLKQLD